MTLKKFYYFSLSVLLLLPVTAAARLPLANPATGILPEYGTPDSLIRKIISILILVVGILSVLFIIIGGFQYITSAGNQEQAEAGKKTFKNAIIGLAIVTLSYIIVVVVIKELSGP